MGNHMVDAYVRRDPNAKNQFDSLGSSEEESLVLPDGILMSSKAFKNTVPQTQYTLAELGIDMAASPYVEALTYEKPEVSGVIIAPQEVHHHAEDLGPGGTQQTETTFIGVSNPVNSINNAVKEYWGLLVLVGVAIGAGYFVGRRG
tara:strand:+ start:12017 stop:12454 length:438 start_codon:yes stop_codon:yes gene_type:complete